jgi:hypothetical protein
MGDQQCNIRQVHAHSNVHNVKTARKFKGNHTGQEPPTGDPAGREPLDTSVFTAGFTFSGRPGYLFVNHRFPHCPAIAGLIRHAQIADKPPRNIGPTWPEVRERPRCRSPPPLRFDFPTSKIETEDFL